MRPIRKLPESLIVKIAAGEVVERPASVVKELVENSIDAGAKRVVIRVAGGGLTSIAVTDDGCGIPAGEVPLALERHATSKIETADDLSRIGTLGFRGEALPVIAGVSHFELLTRTADSLSGTFLRAEGGDVRILEPRGTPAGTTITVSHLFFNTPARRKFLRSKPTEFGQIEKVVRKTSLAHLAIEFVLEHEGEPILHLRRATTLTERIRDLYNAEVASKVKPFEGGAGPLRVAGVVSEPNLGFGRATELHFLANGRPVADRMLQSAVMEGYRTLLMEHRYPLAVVALDLPPHLLDVNVHPAKAEVRFADPQAIFRLVSSSIAGTFRDTRGTILQGTSTQRPAEVSQAPFSFDDRVTTSLAREEPTPYEASPRPGFFSSLEFAGTIDQTYLLFRAPDALYVVDQHAAHERVLFEELKAASAEARPPSQKLLLPISVELSAAREAALDSLVPFLASLGFEIESFGERTVLIRAVPASLGTTDPRSLLIDLSDAAIEEEGEGPWKDRNEALISRVACHAAVRAHDPMTVEEVRELTRRMDRTDLASNCPHGRPTFLPFATGDFERLFQRK